MLRFLITTVANAFGLWVANNLIPQISLTPYGGDGLVEATGTYLVVGAIFGLVNAVLGTLIKIIAFPLYIISFGLISFVVNGALLLFVAYLSTLIGTEVFSIEGFTSEGLTIDTLGFAILGAIVISISAFIARSLLKLIGVR
ncbi:MAG: phage holin family protein [Microbacteriaceae bacterium]|jgi:putative membrane protein|nr:phage holin family protein [Microbacteriaceae bacterium]MDR9444274.1 phage holin family protein [Microbacteriaceae bacterium]